MTDEIRTFDPAAAGWELLLRDGFGGLVGPFWRRQPAEGGVRLGLLTRREHANANGVVHGGAILALDHGHFMALLQQMPGGADADDAGAQDKDFHGGSVGEVLRL